MTVPPSWQRAAPYAWSVVLALLLLGPALAPGYVLTYDMVWVPDLALRGDFLGVASGLPRAVPSDAVVAVLDEILPGQVLQKLMLLSCLVGAGWGIVRLLPDLPLVGSLAAVSAYQWSPFVAERLLIGHWPVLVGYAVLPWLVSAARRWREDGRFPLALALLVPLGSLSASAGVATAVALVAFAAVRAPRRLLGLLALVVAVNAPWVVAGLLHVGTAATDAAGAEVFALQSEGDLPAPLAALTLGGIWNTEVVPGSRTDVLGWLSVLALLALAAAAVRGWSRVVTRRDTWAFVACWVVGLTLALLTWMAPGVVAWLVTHVPGTGLFRDGARLLVLAAPLTAALVGVGVAAVCRWLEPGVPRVLVAGALVGLPVLLMPDAALGLDGRLASADYPASYAAARAAVAMSPDAGDVLLLPLSSYRKPTWNEGRKVLDPAGRYLTRDYVGSDVLVVSGTSLEGEDPRVTEVAAALAQPTSAARSAELARLGIGFVVIDSEAPGDVPELDGTLLVGGAELSVLALDDARPRTTPSGWYAAMAAAWAAWLLCPLVGAGSALRRRTMPLRGRLRADLGRGEQHG
ncbi:MAG: hypothetical protein WKF79_03580 [Nocardioides sp.]